MAMAGGGVRDGKIDVERVGKAVESLLRYVEGAKEQLRIRLLDEDQLLYLVVSLKKLPTKERVNPFKIPLPYPLVELDGTHDLCLIVNDLSRGFLRKQAKQRVLEEGLRVSKVLGFSKLKKNYAGHEARRKLCGSYDLFLVDSRIVNHMPKVLGKIFYKKKKAPIPIDLTKSQWKSQLENICNSTFFYVSTGTCSVVKVGKVSQSRDEILENVVAAIEGVTAVLPGKWEDVLSLHLKTVESLALPIYQATPNFPVKIEVNDSKKNVTRVKLEEVEVKEEKETTEAPGLPTEETMTTPDTVSMKRKAKKTVESGSSKKVKVQKTASVKTEIKEESPMKKKKVAKTKTAGTPVALRTRRGVVSKKK